MDEAFGRLHRWRNGNRLSGWCASSLTVIPSSEQCKCSLMFDIRYSIFDIRYMKEDIRKKILDIGYWLLDVECRLMASTIARHRGDCSSVLLVCSNYHLTSVRIVGIWFYIWSCMQYLGRLEKDYSMDASGGGMECEASEIGSWLKSLINFFGDYFFYRWYWVFWTRVV